MTGCIESQSAILHYQSCIFLRWFIKQRKQNQLNLLQSGHVDISIKFFNKENEISIPWYMLSSGHTTGGWGAEGKHCRLSLLCFFCIHPHWKGWELREEGIYSWETLPPQVCHFQTHRIFIINMINNSLFFDVLIVSNYFTETKWNNKWSSNGRKSCLSQHSDTNEVRQWCKQRGILYVGIYSNSWLSSHLLVSRTVQK